jgi:hypothetical protein
MTLCEIGTKALDVERDPHYGEALCVDPNDVTVFIEEDHPGGLRRMPKERIGMEDHELWSEDVNSHAIRRGWVRVVIFENGERTMLAATSWESAQRAFAALAKQKWSSASRGADLMVDIYGDNP